MTSSNDIEMQRLGKHNYDDNGYSKQQKRIEASLGAVFLLKSDEILRFPGASAIYEYVENMFTPLLDDQYIPIWTAISGQQPKSSEECWSLLRNVCLVLRSPHLSKDSSIEDVWSAVATGQPRNRMQSRLDTTPEDACHIAVFSVLCWSTMAFQPKLQWSDFGGNPSLTVREGSLKHNSLKMTHAKRPIGAIFRQFHRASQKSRWRHPIGDIQGETSAALEVSYLNYSSLHNIAKINIEWVNDWTSHLDFDATKRQLSVFKFPTFCALAAISTNKEGLVPVMEGLLRGLCGIEDENREDHNPAQLYQEILMSYRIVFAQHRGTRRQARKILRQLKDQQPDQYDPLLDIVCTHTCDAKVRDLPVCVWPVTCRTYEGTLQEEGSYSSQDDFPLFGERLAKLQEFSRRQQPSKLSDLWRDRRNPLQWYTFWAVLVVGGLSILIGISQLGVAVAQLANPQHVRCQCTITSSTLALP